MVCARQDHREASLRLHTQPLRSRTLKRILSRSFPSHSSCLPGCSFSLATTSCCAQEVLDLGLCPLPSSCPTALSSGDFSRSPQYKQHRYLVIPNPLSLLFIPSEVQRTSQNSQCVCSSLHPSSLLFSNSSRLTDGTVPYATAGVSDAKSPSVTHSPHTFHQQVPAASPPKRLRLGCFVSWLSSATALS